MALSKIVKMLGPSMDEAIARDVWKQSRNAISSEKSHVVLMGALKVKFFHITTETGSHI